MKTLFTLLIALTVWNCHAQRFDNCNLDPTLTCQHPFIIDTVNYPNNTWQIGLPQKTIFDSAYSLPYAIMTDTINSYPVNDTSVFIVKHKKTWPQIVHFSLSFYYKLDIDSGEIAKVEISGDSGLHWVDLIADDTTYNFGWQGGKPRLDTSTNEWKHFNVVMTTWRNADSSQHLYPSYLTSDTFLYRFTFISDAVQTNKEGWMMDNFAFQDYLSNIEDLRNDKLIELYPNPSTGDIVIKQRAIGTEKSTITVYNLQGQEVYQIQSIPPTGQLQLSLPDGVYYLKYMADEQYSVKKITIVN